MQRAQNVMDGTTPLIQVINHTLAPFSVGWFIAILTGVLTPIVGFVGALFVVLWYGLQLYKDSTIQLWLRTRRLRKIETLKKTLAHLEVRERAELHRGD